jgi:RNA polymerase binding protein RbpA
MTRGTLRGYRWGRSTAEPDRDTDLAARQSASFTCRRGHEFTVQFAAEAAPPTIWTCPRHGVADCRRIDVTVTAPEPGIREGKPARTPLVMLYERRTAAELEALLADTLAAIRRSGGARPGCVLVGGRPYSFRFDG